jgi:hypothetical protein
MTSRCGTGTATALFAYVLVMAMIGFSKAESPQAQAAKDRPQVFGNAFERSA